jgi:hypothetical protein
MKAYFRMGTECHVYHLFTMPASSIPFKNEHEWKLNFMSLKTKYKLYEMLVHKFSFNGKGKIKCMLVLCVDLIGCSRL